MFYLYLSISSLLTLVFLSRRWDAIWRLVASAAAWAIGGVLLYVLSSGVRDLGPDNEPAWWVDGVLFLVLILGMSAKYLWDSIETRNERNTKRNPDQPKVGLEFDFWDFVKPMLVSVIVFSVVTGMKHELSRAAVAGSFQNGFFWQTIFKKKTPM